MTITLPEWALMLVAFVLGLAGYGALNVARGAKRKLRRRAGEVWDQPNLPPK
ncbi:MAG TPA: hypothetical protein VFX49_11760 [Chloroflexota bacterium]|nr:hypothetical protein [Chloroflexota bacterium]